MRSAKFAARLLLALALVWAPGVTEAKIYFDPAGSGQLFNSARQGVPVPLDFPTLVPGPQYGSAWATTATPAARGFISAAGYSEPAIAGWDTPQLLEVNSATPRQQICVDAFHVGGVATTAILKVQFSANNGPLVDAYPLFTAEARQIEYCAYLDVTKFAADQPVEIRAIAIPLNGQPYVLQGGSQAGPFTNQGSLWAYASPVSGPGPTYYIGKTNAAPGNPCTQEAPCTSVADTMASGKLSSSNVSGATVVIQEPGAYDVTPKQNVSAVNRWFTVTTGGSANAGNTSVTTGTSSNDINLLHLANIGVLGTVGRLYKTSAVAKAYLWLDRVAAAANPALGVPGTAASANANYSVFTSDNSNPANPGLFVTDSTFNNYTGGLASANLVRGSTITNTTDDNFSKSLQVVNNTVHNDGLRAMSGPYTISYIADTTHVVIPKTTALYTGDCIQNPKDNSSTGFPGSCVGGGAVTITVDNTTSGNQTLLTLSSALSGSPTKFMQASQNHVDFWQGVGGTYNGLIIYGNTAVDRILGQTIFWDQPATTNSAVVNNALDNTNSLLPSFPGDQSQQLSLNIAGTLTNILFSGNIQKGGVRYIGGTQTDFYEYGDVCTSVRSGSFVPPFMIGSPGC